MGTYFLPALNDTPRRRRQRYGNLMQPTQIPPGFEGFLRAARYVARRGRPRA